MQLDDLICWLRSIAPEESALPDDPVGLIVHPVDRDIHVVAVCLDLTPSTAQAAAAEGAEIVICHHQPLYHPTSRIDIATPVGRTISTLIRDGISAYAMHTNWDGADGGINDTLARKLDLHGVLPLGLTGTARIGRVGNLRGPITVREFATRVSEALDVTGHNALRYSPLLEERIVQRIAVCGGAGASLLSDAIANGAEALVTSDVRHHEFVDADARGAILIDAGHGATERPGMAALAARMRQQFKELKVTLLD